MQLVKIDMSKLT